jgi:transposase
MAKEISEELRKKIINAYHSEKSYTELGNIFSCHRTTIKRIIDAYQNEGRSITRKRGNVGRSKIFSEVHVSTIRACINQNCTISLRELQIKMEEEFGLAVDKSTINRTITSFNYTLKRLSPVPEKRNDQDNIESRFIYASFFLSLSEQYSDKIFFLDEVGFNISMRRRRGRSLSGEGAVMIVPTIRSRNISVCCVMSKRGTFLYRKQDRAFNIETFSIFIDDFLSKLSMNGITNAILVLDNVSFHKSQVIRAKIEESTHTLIFLPPYSPFLNPIENMFSQWKENVRNRRPSNKEELLSLIDSSFLNVSGDHCRDYYENMVEYLQRCLNKEVIMD